ncbi:MCP four helix bundle domain-containing protein, partial [Pseudomonas quasicaspiana]|nr:MCP four helix bundle domain-containing protein [Pseudomonas quasicaspiana]
MNLRNLNIAPRSLLCFGFFALLITALGLFSLQQSVGLKESREALQDNVLPTVQTIEQIKTDLVTIRLGNTGLRAASDAEGAKRQVDRISQARIGLEADVRKLKPLLITEAGQKAFSSMERNLMGYLAVHTRFLDAVAQKREDLINAMTNATGEMTQAAEQLSKDITEVSRLADLKMAESDAIADQTYSQSRNVTI